MDIVSCLYGKIVVKHFMVSSLQKKHNSYCFVLLIVIKSLLLHIKLLLFVLLVFIDRVIANPPQGYCLLMYNVLLNKS